MTWYKVTRPDGGSFHDPTVIYEVGKRMRPKPHKGTRTLCGPGVLHASPSASEAARYGQWPFRVFRVEGKPFLKESDKAGFKQLQVVGEVDVWQAFGSNGREVVAVLERIAVCTPGEVNKLGAARDASRDAAWGAAFSDRDAAWELLTAPWRQVIGVWDGTEWVAK